MIEEDKKGKKRTIGGGKGNRRGTPQGGVISPLLANLYLHLLDRIWERHDIEKRYNARLVRYADDLVIHCKGDASQPLALLKPILDDLDSVSTNRRLTASTPIRRHSTSWDSAFR